MVDHSSQSHFLMLTGFLRLPNSNRRNKQQLRGVKKGSVLETSPAASQAAAIVENSSPKNSISYFKTLQSCDVC
jgi:hypothetical protein